jgi:hypothetical protein
MQSIAGRTSHAHHAAMKPLLSLAAALLLSACVKPVPPERIAQAGPVFLPEVVFAGELIGRGVIQTPGGKPARGITVKSSGRVQRDGSFRLDQTITDDRGKVSQRHWIMARSGDGRYLATLSDAAGPVKAEVTGNLFHLKYLMKKPFVTMEQWLWLLPDGRTIMNEGTIRMPGRTVARLSEVIVREGEGVQ